MNDAHDSQVLAELLKLPDAPLNLSQRRECCNSPLRTADGGLRTPMPISGKRTETNGASSVELRKTTRAKTFRERQKEEMARLRLDVENFTAHLALQRRPTVAEAPSVWGSIARRQCLETQRSQVENAKLHESLEACVAHINSLKTLLNEVKEHARVAAGQEVRSVPLPTQDSMTHQDRAVFALLTNKVALRICPRPQDGGFRLWHSLDECSTGVMHTESNGAYVFEHCSEAILPFSAELVSKVSWKSVSDGKMHIGVRATAAITQSEDTLASQLKIDPSSLSLPLGQNQPRVKTYLVLKRHQQHNGVLLVWESLSCLPEMKQLGTPALNWVQRGWSELAPHKLRSGASGCRIRSYTRAFLGDVDGPAARIDQRTLRLMLMLVDAYATSREHVQRSLESLLLDESARQRKQMHIEVAVIQFEITPRSVPATKRDRGIMGDDLLLPDGLLGLDEWLRGCSSPLLSIGDSLATPTPFFSLPEAPETPGSSIESVATLDTENGENGEAEVKTEATKGKRKRCKSSMQRQKEEMAALRLQAAELKARIDCMAPPQLQLSLQEEDDSVWGAWAKRQGEQREKAEAENAELRAKMTANKKFVRSLGRLLRKAEEWNSVVVSSGYGPMSIGPAFEDREIFVRLARNVDEIGFPRITGVCELSNDVDAAGTIRRDASGACFFEQEGARSMPFDLDLVNKVSWLSVGNGKMHFGVRAIATITQSEDTLASQLSVDPMSYSGDEELDLPQVKTYLVLKRQRKDDRISYAWEALSFLPEVKKLGTPALTWIQRGWNESVPHKLRSGATGCTIRSYTRAFIGDLSGPQVDTDQGQLKLMQILVDAYDKSRVKVYQSLENLMLDEVVRCNKRRRLI